MSIAYENKWRKKWADAKVFAAEPQPGKKKFFGTIPYPYANSYMHLGFFMTSMRYEALARFKRMNGYNVLYAQGFHCTGSPIVNAAKRVQDKEPQQMNILKMQGFTDKQIKAFEDPKAWVQYFPKEAQKDMTLMGFSVDWRREFITTDLNPHYDTFIRWQFRKLKEKGYVTKGKFPVVWDPIENTPVGDHARVEGEGEVPQEYVLVKHQLENKEWVVSATLRPDTIMGITNLYVNPSSELVRAKVDEEIWIISEKTAYELQFQDKNVQIIDHIKGTDLIGKKVLQFSGSQVLILPASFVNTNVGTGIVHSVPSDSADDLIALYDLQNNEETCKKYGLNTQEVKAIQPIAVLDVPGYGEIPADDILKKLGIKNQTEKDKLKKAKEVLYKDGYYKGKFNALYAKGFKQNYQGKLVEHAKDDIKEEVIASKFGDRYYQLTGKVIARTLAECVVKIVDDQWFLAYGDEQWTNIAHECLDNMKLYPDKTRSQFNYVLDWLRNWACTRELGLGTRLPWDEKWLIESLSDSTIYMAYYTIVHKLKEVDPTLLDDAFFDYVLLDQGSPNTLKVDAKLAKELHDEFNYWYPMDFRNTGKDLIQNHMSFCIFNHVAIFPKKHWPKAFGLNGHITINGEKMSKSKGNFITMRQAHADYGADAARFTVLSGGEGVDDANFDTELATSMTSKLQSLLDLVKEFYNTGREKTLHIDTWMDNELNRIIKETTTYYEETLYRSALQSCYFDLQNQLKWYLRRCMNKPHKGIINKVLETQALLLAPITPFIAEEMWEAMGKNHMICEAQWPNYAPVKVSSSEELIKETLADIMEVKKLVDFDTTKVTIFVSAQWKYDLYNALEKELTNTRDFGHLMKTAMTFDQAKSMNKWVAQVIQKAIKSGISAIDLDEYNALEQSSAFLEHETQCKVHIVREEDAKDKKANQAKPGKPAILLG